MTQCGSDASQRRLHDRVRALLVAQGWQLTPSAGPHWLLEVAWRPGVRSVSELARAVPHDAADLVEVDAAGAESWRLGLDVLAEALRFPSYYGRNADAFIECLGDRMADAGRGLVVLLSPAPFWRRARDRARFTEVVGAAVSPPPAGRVPAPFVLVVGAVPEPG